MIVSSDQDYKETKRIKQGKQSVPEPFQELAEWISNKWSVSVLNVRYDSANSLHAPRIQVVLEYKSDAQKFHHGVNYDKKKQEAVAEKFLEIIGRDPSHEFDVDRLFVIFSSFAPIAKQEADSKITNGEIESLKRKIGNPDLWKISRCFGHVTFLFFTDEQVERYEAQGKKGEYAKLYFEILKPHDEFGYLEQEAFEVNFDSKQNFDENYQSNWYYYYH